MVAETTAADAARSFAEQTMGEKLFSLAIFGLGSAVSVAFAYYLITDPSRLEAVWAWTRSTPLLVQAVIWLLALPWMIALWIWTLPWAVPVRFVLVAAVLVWTTWLLFPWK
jgi:ABC-type amino acid transport system permease subunit